MIPTEPLDRKLSKIETLRLAHSYIEHLSAVLCTGKSTVCARIARVEFGGRGVGVLCFGRTVWLQIIVSF